MSLELQVFEGTAELGPAATDWDAVVADTSDIYFTVPWLSVWERHYADGRSCLLFLVRDAGQPIAALPFVVTRHRVPEPVRIATFMGAQETIPVFRPAIRPGRERAALTLVLARLRATVDVLSLTPLSGEAEAAGLIDAARTQAMGADAVLVRDESRAVHTVFELPNSFDEWLRRLDKRRRTNLRRDIRQLQLKLGVTTSVVTGRQAQLAFERFIVLHGEQWRAEGMPGHFGDWPGADQFNRDLVEHFSAPASLGEVLFHEIRNRDGSLLSSQYVFVMGESAYWRLPARRVGAEYDGLGLGRAGLGLMIEALIARGIRRIEAGPGHYDYKLKHGGTEYSLCRLVIAPCTPAHRPRRLMLWADVLHLVYYRLWVRRIAPRWARMFNRPRPPLARFWIRSRF